MVLYLLALWMVIFIIWPLQQRGRVVAAGLAAMWLWTGVACQGMRHWTISAAAWGFVELFVIQGLLFIEAGVVRGRLAFGSCQGWACWLV